MHVKLLRLVCFLANGWFSSFAYLLDFCLGLVGLVAVGLHCDVASVVGLVCCGFWLVEWFGDLRMLFCLVYYVGVVCGLWCGFVRLVCGWGWCCFWALVNDAGVDAYIAFMCLRVCFLYLIELSFGVICCVIVCW